jgi:hypothetical protein
MSEQNALVSAGGAQATTIALNNTLTSYIVTDTYASFEEIPN